MSFEKGHKKNLPTKNLYDKDKEVGKVSALPLIFVMQDNSIIYKGGTVLCEERKTACL